MAHSELCMYRKLVDSCVGEERIKKKKTASGVTIEH